MHLQIETVTTTQGRMDVICDIEAVKRLNDVAERLAHRLRLWSTGDGEMLCSEDEEALKEWDALSFGGSDAPKMETAITAAASCNQPPTQRGQAAEAERRALRPGTRGRRQTENLMSKSKDAMPGSQQQVVSTHQIQI